MHLNYPMSTLRIKYCEIPGYLKDGEFYRALNGDNPDELIEIPEDCFQADGNTASNVAQFRQLLRVVTFWMLDDIPFGVLTFCAVNDVSVWRKIVETHPGPAVRCYLDSLLMAYMEPNVVDLDRILKTKRMDIMFHALARLRKDSEVTAWAAGTGELILLRLVRRSGFEWHIKTCAAASQRGHLKCLQYAHENGCPWGANDLEYAAQYGHVHCIQNAHKQGLIWNVRVCATAAKYGQIECLRFAHEHGCGWNRDTVTAAAESSHMDCLRYALQHGCPIAHDACHLVCSEGRLGAMLDRPEMWLPLICL